MGGQNTALGEASTGLWGMLGNTDSHPSSCSVRSSRLMEEIIDLARGFRIDAGDLLQIRNRSAFDRLERSEMPQQRPLAGRADPGDLLQPGLADVAPPPLAMRSDREAMRLIAQALDEIEHRVARLEPEGLAAGHEERLAPGVPIGALGDGDQRHVVHAELAERLARGIELPEPTVDQHEIRPGRIDAC